MNGTQEARNGLIHQVMPSVVALIVGAFSAYISFQVSLAIASERITNIQRQVNRLDGQFNSHAGTEGHAVIVERVDAIRADVQKLIEVK